MQRPNQQRFHRAGFTLIEGIIAVVILAIAIPPMIWSMREAHFQRVNPIMSSQARWLITEKLEDIIADRHSTTRGYEYVTDANYPPESFIEGFPGLGRVVEIVETGPDLVTAGEGYKVVAVSVSWKDATLTVNTLRIATVITDF